MIKLTKIDRVVVNLVRLLIHPYSKFSNEQGNGEGGKGLLTYSYSSKE